MSEFIGGETKFIKTGEPIVFENNTDHDFDVDVGVIFHKSGLYDVVIDGKRVVVSKVTSQKKGKWKIINFGAAGAFDSCSECKKIVKHKIPFYNFCPNCGADMKGEARWLHSDDLSETLVCSACGYDTEDYEPYASCPNCGARMRKRDKG